MNSNIPKIIKNVLNEENFNFIKKYSEETYKLSTDSGKNYDKGFGRYVKTNSHEMQKIHDILIPVARENFEINDLIPAWSIMYLYDGPDANLLHHKDNNGCVYNVNYCIYQKTPWSIWVENKEYYLEDNDAVLMYGNDQEHWREDFPDPENNKVFVVSFFFSSPDHWFFDPKLNTPKYENWKEYF